MSAEMKLETTEEALRNALAWYGEQARLARLVHSEGDPGRWALAEDGGKRAREVLAISASPAGVVKPLDDEVIFAVKRPEGYEDVHPELVGEDCFNGEWEWRIIPAANSAGVGVETQAGWIRINGNLSHEAAEALLKEGKKEAVDRLPKRHVVLEQADMMDGRVSQTVRAADGSEYERIVHADEAYGEDE